MKSAFGDTLESVTHGGPGLIKFMPDALFASYNGLALLDLMHELELTEPAIWMEDPFCCLQSSRNLQLTPKGKSLTLGVRWGN